MTAAELIDTAARHAERRRPMRAYALNCLADARANLARGELTAAYRRAKDSLRYSVGELHRDYRRA